MTDNDTITYYLVGCPECNKDLDYTINVEIDQSYAIQGNPGARLKKAAQTLVAEHNAAKKHTARLIEYRYAEEYNAATEEEKELLRREKVKILKDLFALYS